MIMQCWVWCVYTSGVASFAIMHIRDPDRPDHRDCECYSFIVSDRIPFSTLVESHRAALNYAEPYVGPIIGGNIAPTGQGFMVIALPHMRRRIPTAGVANPKTQAQNGKHARSAPSQLATRLALEFHRAATTAPCGGERRVCSGPGRHPSRRMAILSRTYSTCHTSTRHSHAQ
jgi:hypothetical protein